MVKNKNENLETMWKYLLTNRIVVLVLKVWISSGKHQLPGIAHVTDTDVTSPIWENYNTDYD